MVKKLVFTLVLIQLLLLVGAKSTYAQFVTEQGDSTHTLQIASFPYSPELSPMIRTIEGNQIHAMSSSNSFLCNISPMNFLTSNVLVPYSDCFLTTKALVNSSISSNGGINYLPPDQLGNDDWRFTYNGITGLDTIDVNGQKYLITIKHNEHQNLRAGEYLYQGRILTHVLAEDCASGYVNNVYQHCWESFSSFVSIGYAPINSAGEVNGAQFIDIGPIVWPPNGYIDENRNRRSSGFYHPTLFVDDDYIYAYYLNDNNLQSGQRKCLSASRVAISQFNDPEAWQNYYQGSFSTTSLPEGFDKDNMEQFYTVGGGNADCVSLPNSTSDAIIFFNAAKISGTDLYIGTEESAVENQNWQVGVRVSRDLVNWSEMQVLATAPGPWGNGTLSYPTFIDNQGLNTNEVVDPSNFYLVGKSATNSEGYELNSTRLTLDTGELFMWDVTNLLSRYGQQQYNDPNNDGVVNGMDLVEAINRLGD
ncbi:MAG: hypothetical protein QY318_00180 [Candidatus Dojkabacteria bacterium]|nr:MAG: hypothetical protein QY318_00180 [Candidatus Dojkabacteria bacterium]